MEFMYAESAGSMPGPAAETAFGATRIPPDEHEVAMARDGIRTRFIGVIPGK
jgi:hypothetical protein